MLKPDGRIVVLCMEWLPYDDEIAGASEKLVLKYNPSWSGAGAVAHEIEIPECYNEKFIKEYHEEYFLDVYFTRKSWNGRMKSCRGTGASLSDNELSEWEKEHISLLERIAPEEFYIKHYAAYTILKKRNP